jgi:[ribosomal protein S5]-alanine N-acetyltransferase
VSELVPTVATSRLTLRALRRADFEAYAACLAEWPTPPGPMDRRNAWRSFAASSGGWLLDGCGWWAVELEETKELVGTCGVFRREDHPERDTTADEVELGWTIFSAFRRRGFATEAAGGALKFAFGSARAERVIAHIDHENHASIRVSRSIGMHYAREVSFYGAKLGLYVVERSSIGE